MNRLCWLLAVLAGVGLLGCEQLDLGEGGSENISEPVVTGPLPAGEPVHGWAILSDSEPDARAVIEAAPGYGINHLQLSHQVIPNLREARDEATRGLTNRLIDAAHEAGIREVVVWDHALYELDHYPARFRGAPDGKLDFDDPDFWAWFKQDYRDMLDLLPDVDGLVLTFIETEVRADEQYSRQRWRPQQKLAAVVDAVADVVVGERKLNLYVRTFAYTQDGYDDVVAAVELIERPEVRLMVKATPHDFFLTHPTHPLPGTIARPTVIEFDAAGDFSGQGLIANTWPQHVLARWQDLGARDHVIGYVARTDRYGDTRIVGTPGEINLLALQMGAEDPNVDSEAVYDAFVTERYGQRAWPFIEAAFKNAFDIVAATLYTLGTNTTNHSQLDYHDDPSSYARHVSGRWLDEPEVYVSHGVDTTLHYWRDVVGPLAPPWAKSTEHNEQLEEVRDPVRRGWLRPREEMDEATLGRVLAEKDYGVELAEASVRQVEQAQPYLNGDAYESLHRLFERTLLTARLHRAVAAAYFGFRVYARGEAYQTPFVLQTVEDGLAQVREAAAAIEAYPYAPAEGQWNWAEDAARALQYHAWIAERGWPQMTNGFENPYGGERFTRAAPAATGGAGMR